MYKFCIFLFFILKVLISQTNKYVYYVSGKPNGHGIWVSNQNTNNTWPAGNKVMLNNAFDGDAVDPDILDLGNNTLRMYYFKGYFITPPPPSPGPNTIYSATSSDGINFTIHGIAFQYNNITDPSVVKLSNGNYLMACAQHTNVVLATSTDGGLTFNYSQTLLNTGIPELYVLDNGHVRLFHSSPGGIASKISYDNGLSWQSESGLCLSSSSPIVDPSVIKINSNTWWMFVKGFNGNGNPGPAGHKIMLAESTDGTQTFNFINTMIIDSASVPDGLIYNFPLGISSNNTLDNSVIIFPNPCNETLNVEINNDDAEVSIVKVMAMSGNCVLEKRADNKRLQLPLKSISPGVYFLEIKNKQGEIKRIKFLIN
jgi:hypothetical protein